MRARLKPCNGAIRPRHSEVSAAMRFVARLLLAFSSLCLASGGVVHALAFPKAATVAEHSALPAFFSAAFNGLWLNDSVASVALALAFGSIAAFPGMASRSLVLLLALAPLAFATAIFATMGNFFAGHLMLLAGTAALIGGALHRYAAKHPVGSVGPSHGNLFRP
jgi:hypothetical protein